MYFLIVLGVYEDSIGTNVFLKEAEEQPKDNVFCRKTPIHLIYFTKTSKCIKLKWLKIPEETARIDTTEMIKLNLKQDYKINLKNFKENKLNIADIAQKEVPKPPKNLRMK